MKLLLLLLLFVFYWSAVFSLENRAPKRKNRGMTTNNNNRRRENWRKNPLDKMPRRGLSLLHEDKSAEDMARDGQNLGCSFGDRFYELGQTWHPDLGEPFGVLACTKCNCSTITKKRRVIGKVVCNNLANSCPKLHCPKVVSIKGQCCNVCADASATEKLTNLQEKVEKRQKMIHGEFMALLTGRFKSPPVHSDNLARAYITLNDKDLHFAILYEKLDEQPSSVQILDGQDYLLYEKNLSTTTNNKICGVWQNVPSIFTSNKKLSQLLIVLSTKKQPDGLIGGHLIKHKTLNREVFGTLLKPNSLQTSKNFGAGGAAAFEVAKGGKNLKMMLWFNATFDKAEADPQVIVWLERNDGVRRKIDMAAVIRAEHSSAYHTVEMSINIHPTEKSHLMKGHLTLVVTSNEMSPTELTGRVAPKSTCDVFHAVSDIVDAGKLSNNVLGAASIKTTLNSNGTVTFDVKIIETSREDESQPQATFRLVKENPRNKKARTILSSGAMVESSSGMRIIRNVSISRIPLRDRDAFYKGKLYAQLEIEKHGVVKARINRLPFREALAGNQALFVAPITINRLAPRSVNENVKPIPTTPLPIALFYNVENLNSFQTPCQFFYLLAVYDSRSANEEKSFKLSLCQKNSPENCAPLNFSSRENLVGPDRSSGLLLIGRSDYLYSDQWVALRDGRAYFNLTLTNSQKQQSVVTGPITVAETWCERSNRLQSDRLIAEDNRLLLASLKNRVDNPPIATCYFEGVVYEDGEMFVSKKRSCTHCNCNRGSISCEKTICPSLNCDAASIVTVAGQCCPMCKSPFVNDTKGTPLNAKSCHWTDGQTYFIGETWHPYVAPFGFDKCALCTCGTNTKVSCSRPVCPTLSCPLIMRYREHSTDCCAKCKDGTNVVKLAEAPLRPVGLSPELSTGCFFNNRLYTDGAVFSPKLRKMSTLKCIKCTCLKSRVKCRKETPTSLDNKISKYGAC